MLKQEKNVKDVNLLKVICQVIIAFALIWLANGLD